MKHTSNKRRPAKRMPQQYILALGLLSVVSSFVVGVETAGDLETVTPTQANELRMSGDMDGDGRLTVQDAIDILEVAQGYEEATPEQLQADPNGDGTLTVEDAMRLLSDISSF